VHAADNTRESRTAAHSSARVHMTRKNRHHVKIAASSFQPTNVTRAKGGILITDDANLAARCDSLCSGLRGTTEETPGTLTPVRGAETTAANNLRLSIMSAVFVRAQTSRLPRQRAEGLPNHDLSRQLNAGHRSTSRPLPPDPGHRNSSSFKSGWPGRPLPSATLQCQRPKGASRSRSLFQARDNARAFWKRQFNSGLPDLPQPAPMLMNRLRCRPAPCNCKPPI